MQLSICILDTCTCANNFKPTPVQLHFYFLLENTCIWLHILNMTIQIRDVTKKVRVNPILALNCFSHEIFACTFKCV